MSLGSEVVWKVWAVIVCSNRASSSSNTISNLESSKSAKAAVLQTQRLCMFEFKRFVGHIQYILVLGDVGGTTGSSMKSLDVLCEYTGKSLTEHHSKPKGTKSTKHVSSYAKVLQLYMFEFKCLLDVFSITMSYIGGSVGSKDLVWFGYSNAKAAHVWVQVLYFVGCIQ